MKRLLSLLGVLLVVHVALLFVRPRGATPAPVGDAVDYDHLYRTVREVVEQQSFHLLERLAATTAEAILSRFAVRRVRVRIAKQNLGWTTGGRAVIEVVRERSA